MKNSQLQPTAHHVCGRLIHKTADVRATKGKPTDAQSLCLRIGNLHMFPSSDVVSSPNGSVALTSTISRTSQDEWPFLFVQFFKSFKSSLRHLLPINIVRSSVIARLTFHVMHDFIRKSLAVHFKDSRFIHVIPKTTHSDVQVQFFVQGTPPVTHFFFSKIREHTILRPHWPDHQFAIGALAKIAFLNPLIIDKIIGIDFYSGIDHDHRVKAFIFYFIEYLF